MAKATVGLDAVLADSKHYKVEDENERVRILRAVYGPGEKSQMHAHPATVVFFVTDGHIRFTFPDGTSQDAQAKAGQAMAMEPTTHNPENLGNLPVEAVIVELKN